MPFVDMQTMTSPHALNDYSEAAFAAGITRIAYLR